MVQWLQLFFPLFFGGPTKNLVQAQQRIGSNSFFSRVTEELRRLDSLLKDSRIRVKLWSGLLKTPSGSPGEDDKKAKRGQRFGTGETPVAREGGHLSENCLEAPSDPDKKVGHYPKFRG